MERIFKSLDQIQKLDSKVLLLIIVLIPFNQIALNYLIKIHLFKPISQATDYWIRSTFVASLFSLIIFSIIIFRIGRLNLPSVWLTKEKLKTGVILVAAIWILALFSTTVWTFWENGKIGLTPKINFLAGSLIGQLFGNAAFEELIYRGTLFMQFHLMFKQKMRQKRALLLSVLASQLLFALIHLPNRLLIQQVDNLALDLISLFLAGIILTLIYLRTENLAFVIGAHALVNQPFNIIETSFPMRMMVLILIILTAVFWDKITKDMFNFT